MEPLTVRGELNSLANIAKFVTVAAAEAGLDKKAAYRLRLAVDEIATNVITHGYDEADRVGDVDLRADIDEETLTICLEDTGVTYEPEESMAPYDLHLPLEEREMGGLGVFLAIKNVDKFLYERVEDRNRHIFIVNLTTPSAEE